MKVSSLNITIIFFLHERSIFLHVQIHTSVSEQNTFCCYMYNKTKQYFVFKIALHVFTVYILDISSVSLEKKWNF